MCAPISGATSTFGIDRVSLNEARLEFTGGVTAKLNNSVSLYAQGGYQCAVSDSDDPIEGFERAVTDARGS
jgi:hypothetical protein